MAFSVESAANCDGNLDSDGIVAPSTSTGTIGRFDSMAKRISCVITSFESPKGGIEASRSNHLLPIKTTTAPHFPKVSSMTVVKLAPGLMEPTYQNTCCP